MKICFLFNNGIEQRIFIGNIKTFLESINYSNSSGGNSSSSDSFRGNNSPSNRHQVVHNQVQNNSGFKPFYKK